MRPVAFFALVPLLHRKPSSDLLRTTRRPFEDVEEEVRRWGVAFEHRHQPRPAGVGERVSIELAHMERVLQRVVRPEDARRNEVAQQDVDAVVLPRHQDAPESDECKGVVEVA